jgi:hypothetical protein
MPGATYVQSNIAQYATAGSGGSLPCAYLDPNASGNIGLAYLTGTEGETAATVTDSNGNTWYELPGTYLPTGYETWWVCPVLKAGANTVTAGTGLTESAAGNPTLVVIEFQPPPCPVGSCGIQTFQPALSGNPFGSNPVFGDVSEYSASQGAFYHTLIDALYDTEGNGATPRTWAITVPAGALASGIVQQWSDPSGNGNGAIAYATVPYPALQNFVTFTPTPGTPAVDSRDLHLAAVLISAVA